MSPTPGLAFWLSAAICTMCQAADAHSSPGDHVHSLSHLIARDASDPASFVKRGDAHLALGDFASAASDYRTALSIAPENYAAKYGLVRSLFKLKSYEEMRREAELATASLDAERAAPFHAKSAQAYAADGNDVAAVEAWAKANSANRPDLDWLLGHADALSRLGKKRDALALLSDAVERNPSVVLERRWLAAMIECGDHQVAGEKIARGLMKNK